jgi:PAS domain S-box-containing protein
MPETSDPSAPMARLGITHPEDALRLSEERFRLLVASVVDYAIFMLDPDGYVSSWNLGAERIKGYRAHEIIGKHFSTFYPAEDVRAGKCDLELEVANRVGRFEDEGWRVRKDGTRFWANVVITPLREPKSGDLIGFAKITRDLTERRRAEAQQLDLAKTKAAVRMRDEFISIASHELRTPLTTLRMQAESIARALRRETVDLQLVSRKVGMVSTQVDRLERLVDTLLDVSRIEAGRLELELREFDLSALVREVVKAFAVEIERHGCPVLVDDVPVSGTWDRSRIDQVVTNLLSNALKYGDGRPVEVGVRALDGFAVLTVKDQGLGIAPENQKRIFERFERMAEAKTYSGIGLGLWLSREIVEAHGGSIEVSSEVGEGSTFTVKLPL